MRKYHVVPTLLLLLPFALSAQNRVLRDLSCTAASGSGSAYTCSFPVAVGAYLNKEQYGFWADVANTGAATVNFSSLGAKAIKKPVGGITTDIAVGDIRAGQFVLLRYDGTNMQMLSQVGAGTGGSVTNLATGCGLTGGPVTVTGTIKVSPTVNAISSTSYSVITADCGLVDKFTGISPAVALPAPVSFFPNGWYLFISFAGSGNLVITPSAATINGAASVTIAASNGAGGLLISDGTNWSYISGGTSGGGGGGGAASGIQQFDLTKTSATVLTLCSTCSSSTPGVVMNNGVLAIAALSPPTITLGGSTSSGTVFTYLANGNTPTVCHNTAATITASAGWTVVSSCALIPPDAIATFWQPTFTSNVWDAVAPATMDIRGISSPVSVGANLSKSKDGTTGNITLDTNPLISPRYFTSAGTPGGTCTAGRDFDTDTTNLHLYFCDATNTWKQADGAGGGGFPPITPGTYYEYDNFLTNNAGVAGGNGLLAWNDYSSSGGQATNQATSSATSVGGITLTTGATSGNDVSWLRGGISLYKNFHTAQSFTMRASVIGVTSDSNTLYRFGSTDSNAPGSGQPVNGVYIEKAAADTSWFGVCRAGGTQTRTSALASVSAGTQIAFSISFVSSGTIRFKTAATVAGLAVATNNDVTTNCPSVSTGVAFGAGTATTASKSLIVLFYDMYITGLGY